MSPVILAVVTQNKKLLGCSATYVAQQSCPECVLRGNGCYAETGPMAWGTTTQVNKAGKGKTPFQLAQIERRMIQMHAVDLDAIGRPLRLHVVGDCKTPAAAREVAKGAEVWNKTTGGKVWTYTHAWGKVERKHWGDVSVLASVEDIRDLSKAWHRGYAPAMIVPRFENGAKAWKLGEWNVIPCPEQTLGIGCRKCGLCMRDSWLRESKSVIGFRPHGARAKTVLRQIGR